MPAGSAFDETSDGLNSGPQGHGIYTVQPDGGDFQRLTEGDTPVWSPDGTQIAFTRTKKRQTNIYIMDIDGYDKRLLTYNRLEEKNLKLGLAWSPDGTKLAFISLGEPYDQIVVVMLESGEIQEMDVEYLTPYLSWSPDSTQIVFAASGGTQLDL